MTTSQDTVLIIKKSAILDPQLPLFQPVSSIILSGTVATNEVKSLDCHIPATYHRNVLRFCSRALGNESCPSFHSLQSEVILCPGGHVPQIVPGVDSDDIAILGNWDAWKAFLQRVAH